MVIEDAAFLERLHETSCKLFDSDGAWEMLDLDFHGEYWEAICGWMRWRRRTVLI